jgi:hypothetical protein
VVTNEALCDSGEQRKFESACRQFVPSQYFSHVVLSVSHHAHPHQTSQTHSFANPGMPFSELSPLVKKQRTHQSQDARSTHINDSAPHLHTTCLPHTLITSDLGEWGRTAHLRFSHFLPENPSIAVFSETQNTPVPHTWRRRRSWFLGRFGFRCRLYKGCLQVRPACRVRVIVGSGWQYKISLKSIQHWSAEAGLLLVDWDDMYEDYFAQEAKESGTGGLGRLLR